MDLSGENIGEAISRPWPQQEGKKAAMSGVGASLESAPRSLSGRLRHALTRRGNLVEVVTRASQVLAIRLAGAGLTYASMVLLARWLGPDDFGIYVYILVIVTLLGLAFSFGLSSSGLRFIPHYLTRKRLSRLSGFLRLSHGIVLGLGFVGALCCVGLAFLFRDLIGPVYFTPLLVGLICVPVWTLLAQLEATARSFGWVNVAYFPGYILRPLLLTAFVGGIVWLHGSVSAVTALWGLIGACVIGALVQGFLIVSRVRPRLAEVRPVFHTGYWFTISLSFLMIDGFRMLLDNADVLMIGHLLDPRSVAIYFAVIRSGGLVAFVSFSMMAFAVPKFTEIYSTGTRPELQKFVSEVIQMTFWPSLLTAIALAVLGPFILSLFGAGFDEGYPAMLIVLGGLVLRSTTGPAEYLLNVTGHHRDTIRVYAIAAVVVVALNLILIPTLGIIGAAIATYTAMLGGNACLYFLVRKRLGVSAFIIHLR